MLQAMDWRNAPAQKQKSAFNRAQRQLQREEAGKAALLKAQARKAAKAAAAERQAAEQHEQYDL